jgi:hypothetical protein
MIERVEGDVLAVMMLSMIIYDLNYSRIGERHEHRVDCGGGRMFSLHVTRDILNTE